MKFTDKAIKNLKPRDQRYEVAEDNGKGLVLRVSPSGNKSFVYVYRFAGRLRRMTLGNYPGTTLEDVHVLHSEARKLRKKNIDPIEQKAIADEQLKIENQHKKEALQREKAGRTIAELAEQYLERHAKQKKRSWREDERVIKKDITPAWGHRRVKDIKRQDVADLLDRIVDRGAPVAANRTLALLSRMFNFAIERGSIEHNPCARITPPGEERSRERVLTADEIKTFWYGLEKAGTQENIKLALKFQMVTAQRRGEVATARKADIDLDEKVWTIPVERSKNKMLHRVPLTNTAAELAEALIAFSRDSEWLVPSPRGEEHITERALTRAIGNNRKSFPIPHFTPHDLRRTAASQMAESGIPRLHISMVLNHVEGGITRVYDRYTYMTEKREALERWEQRLADILESRTSKVVPLERARS